MSTVLDEKPGFQDGIDKGQNADVARLREGEATELSVPRLKLEMGTLAVLATGFNISQAWLIFPTCLLIAFTYGGPVPTIYGIVVMFVVYGCIAITLAELVSAYPTIGGQYHWTSILAPPSVNRFMSFTCGMISWASWITLTAAGFGALGNYIFAIALEYDANFVVQRWMSFLLYQAMNLMVVGVNLLLYKRLDKFYDIGLFISIAAFLAIFIACLAKQDHKQDSTYVWTTISNVSGWPSGVQFLISLSAPTLMFSPLDGAVHLCQEVRNAPRMVPRVIIITLCISFVTGFSFAIAMFYCTSDFEAALFTRTNFPMYEIWKQAMGGSGGATAFMAILLVILPFGTVPCGQVASRMTWSMAQDHALLFSPQLSKVNEHFGNPVLALLFNGVLIFLIGLFYLFSVTAYYAIIGVATILQQITFAFPAALLLYHRRSAAALPPNRSFKVPEPIGWISNIITVLFSLISTTFYVFPYTSNPTTATMNYACAVTGAIIIIAIMNWFLYARKHYNGPRSIMFHTD